MGTIYKNGIKYGGGSGDNIPVYTTEEYEQIKDTIPEGTKFIISDDYQEENLIDNKIKDKTLDEKINNVFNSFPTAYKELAICFVSKDIKTVTVGTKGFTCYTTINEAIDTEYPNKGYKLGLLVIILEGTYTECVRLYGKENVSIVGIDKNKCILFNEETEDKHGYYYPPLWINPSTTIMNLTVNCNNNYNDNNAYCIHSDDDGKGRVLIKNCNLYCHQHACIGFGTRQDAPLFVEDCFMCNDNGTAGKLFYGHNSPGGNSTVEELHITRCYGRTAGKPALDIFNASQFYPTREDAPKNSGDFLVYMNDNELYTGNSIIPSALTESTFKGDSHDKENYFSAYVRKMPTNSGNNMPFANFDKVPSVMIYCDDANDALPDTTASRQCYKLDVSAKNLPDETSTYWVVEAFRYDIDLGIQLAYATHFTTVYERRYITGGWTAWAQIK